MGIIVKEVTGTAADLGLKSVRTVPTGGTEKGPKASGPINSKKMLKEARGNYDINASADTDAHGLSKGPQGHSVGSRGTSMSGNGKGRF